MLRSVEVAEAPLLLCLSESSLSNSNPRSLSSSAASSSARIHDVISSRLVVLNSSSCSLRIVFPAFLDSAKRWIPNSKTDDAEGHTERSFLCS